MLLSRYVVLTCRALEALLLASFVADTALAQPADLRLNVRPTKSFFLDQATGYGVFGPLRELEVELQVVNDTRLRTITLEPGFLNAIRWSMRSLSDHRLEPLTAIEATEFECRGARQLRCVAGVSVSLPPEGVLVATLELRTQGVAISAGSYQLDVDLRQAKSMLRAADAASSIDLLDHGVVRLDVRAIETVEDEKRFHMLEGGRAVAKRDFGTALRHFQQITALDPGDTSGSAAVGDALMGLGRLEEAAQLFEQLLPAADPHSSVLPRLAAIYIALGRERKALDLLNARYPLTTVNDMLPHLRRHASTLRKAK